MIGSLLLDTIAILASIIPGLLGAFSILSLGPAASYALISIGGTIGLSWIVTLIHSKHCKADEPLNN